MSDNTTTKSDSKTPADKPEASCKEIEQRALHSLYSPEGLECLKEFFDAQFELNHDLNNPLAGVVGYLELALTDSDSIPERPLELLMNVQKCANRMDELIQEFVKSKRKLQDSVDISAIVTED